MRPRSWQINRYAPAAFHEPATPMGKPWEIRAAATDATEILLYGEIGWDIMAGEFIAELNGITTPNITLRINSGGGDAFDGIAMYNGLVRHHARIVTHVDGFAASAATIVMMAGDEIVAESSTQLMIHNAWGVTVGDYRDHERQRATLNDLCDQMADIYAARAGGTRADWRAVMDAETRYTADRAQEAGLVDRVNAPKGRPEPPADDTVDDEQLAAMSDRDAVSRLYVGRAAAPPPAPVPATVAACGAGASRSIPAAVETRPGWTDLDPELIKIAAAFAEVNPNRKEAAR